jgi:hypothetical protein
MQMNGWKAFPKFLLSLSPALEIRSVWENFCLASMLWTLAAAPESTA